MKYISALIATATISLTNNSWAQVRVSGDHRGEDCMMWTCGAFEPTPEPAYVAGYLILQSAAVNISYTNATWVAATTRGTTAVKHTYTGPCLYLYTLDGTAPPLIVDNEALDSYDWLAHDNPNASASAEMGVQTPYVMGCGVTLQSLTASATAAPGTSPGPGLLSLTASSQEQLVAYRWFRGYGNIEPFGCTSIFDYGIGKNNVVGSASGGLRGTCTVLDPEEPIQLIVDIQFPAAQICVQNPDPPVVGPDGPLFPDAPAPVITEIVIRRGSNGSVIRRFFRIVNPADQTTVVFSTDDSGNSTGYGSSTIIVEELVTNCSGVDVDISYRPVPPIPTPTNCSVALVDVNNDNVVDWRDRRSYGAVIDAAPAGVRPSLYAAYVAWSACWKTYSDCDADTAGAGQTTTPDGELSADDLISYINMFFNGNAAADIAGAGQVAVPDGAHTADDIIVFVSWFFSGC